ncbi:MAG: hypothetical protein RIC52_12630 [Amphiplicatus sp.]
MKNSVLCAAAALAALGASAPALAQTDGRTYWTVNAGASFPPSQDLDGNFNDDGESIPFSGEVEFDPGFFGSLAWGYNFAPLDRSGLGLEVEGFYQALNPEGFSFGGVDLDPEVDDEEEFFAGNASLFGGMVNAVYHIRSASSPWRAKVGGGVGYGRLAYDIDNAFDDGDGVLVYQGFGGLGYALTERLEAGVTARYFGGSDTEFDDDDFFAESQINTFVTTVGLTWYN